MGQHDLGHRLYVYICKVRIIPGRTNSLRIIHRQSWHLGHKCEKRTLFLFYNGLETLRDMFLYYGSPLKRQRKVPLIIWANKHLQVSPSFESGEASTHLLHSAFALDAWEQTSWSIGVLIAHLGTEPQHLQLVLDVKFCVMKASVFHQAGLS